MDSLGYDYCAGDDEAGIEGYVLGTGDTVVG